MRSAALLTLIERKTRKLIIRKIKDKIQALALHALNGIERSMGKELFRVTFLSITADNGSELLDGTVDERPIEQNPHTPTVRGKGEVMKIPTASPVDLFRNGAI